MSRLDGKNDNCIYHENLQFCQMNELSEKFVIHQFSAFEETPVSKFIYRRQANCLAINQGLDFDFQNVVMMMYCEICVDHEKIN